MKTIKLLTILFAFVISLSVASTALSAETQNNEVKKSSPLMKALDSKTQENTEDSKKSTDNKFVLKAFDNAQWNQKSYEKTYEPGKIQTH